MMRAPRPLPLHMMASLSVWGSAPTGAMALATDMPHWPGLDAAGLNALKETIPAHRQSEFIRAVSERAQGRLQAYLAGLEAYKIHPYRRVPTDSEVIWQSGVVTLNAYGAGTPVLLVPSLINPAWILDLKPGHSLVEFLVTRGYRPLLIDWGDLSKYTQADEVDFTLEDYVLKRLIPALELAAGGAAVPIIGYCMGGVLAAALASYKPDMVENLALLAAPWDFSASGPEGPHKLAPLFAAQVRSMPASVPLPMDFMQVFFKLLDPSLDDRKFRAFSKMDQSGVQAEFFVALEDWVNAGSPLAQKVALTVLQDWYQDNLPYRRKWMLGGQPVELGTFKGRTLVVTPTNDKLVPAPSARAILEALHDPTHLQPNAGHVGMVVGRRARSGLWEPLADFIG